MGTLSVCPSMRMFSPREARTAARRIDGIDRGSAHGRSTSIIEADFAKTDDETFLYGLDVDHAASNLACQRFFQLRLDVFEKSGSRGGAEDALHVLHESLHIGGSFDIFDRLHLRERHGFAAAERDAGVGGSREAAFIRGPDSSLAWRVFLPAQRSL